MHIFIIILLCFSISSCGRMVYPELYREDGTGGWSGQFAAFDGVDYKDFSTFVLANDLQAVLDYIDLYPSQKYSYVTIERIAQLLDKEAAESEWFYNYIHNVGQQKVRNPQANNYNENTVYSIRLVNKMLKPKLMKLSQDFKSTVIALRALSVDVLYAKNISNLEFSNREDIFGLIVETASDDELIDILNYFFLDYDFYKGYEFHDALVGFLGQSDELISRVENNYLLYLLSGDISYFNAHLSDVREGRIKGDKRFFEEYFIFAIKDFSTISRFFDDVKLCQDCNNQYFYEAISRSDQFGKNLSLNSFMSSDEYRHFFDRFGYTVSEYNQGGIYNLVVSSRKNSISIELSAQVQCEPAEQVTNRERVGFFEGLGLSLENPNQYASEKIVTYQSHRCAVSERDKLVLQQIAREQTEQIQKGLNGFGYRSIAERRYIFSNVRPVYIDDSKDESVSSVSNRTSSLSSNASSSSSLVDFYDGGYRSSTGNKIMILECRGKGRYSVFYDQSDAGQWKDSAGFALGNQFKGIPLNRSNAEIFCNSR